MPFLHSSHSIKLCYDPKPYPCHVDAMRKSCPAHMAFAGLGGVNLPLKLNLIRPAFLQRHKAGKSLYWQQDKITIAFDSHVDRQVGCMPSLCRIQSTRIYLQTFHFIQFKINQNQYLVIHLLKNVARGLYNACNSVDVSHIQMPNRVFPGAQFQ